MQDDVRFSVGHVVGLPSGGPNMVVSSIRGEAGDVVCVWFHAPESAELLERTFYAETLCLNYGEPAAGYPEVQLHPGQMVRLRSGGPDMTVEYVKDDGYSKRVSCIWFAHPNLAQTPSTAIFNQNTLVVVE